MSYFRKPPPRFRLSGFAVVAALGLFDLGLIALVVYDIFWRAP